MKFFSKACTYGIRAALYLASRQEEEPYVPIREISAKLNISFHFLTKIIQVLTEKKLVNSFRGPNGGVMLARPAGEISLEELVLALESPQFFEGCVLQLPGCGDMTPCPFHESWGPLRDTLKLKFRQTSLEEMNRQIKANGLRLGML